MQKLFVIMPFGIKKASHLPSGQLDFDYVYANIIKPAGQDAGWNVLRIDELVEPGLVSDQYFREILSADLLLADISAHNANVFYELGVRQAVSTGGTILFAYEGTHIPFDLSTQRVLFYQIEEPRADEARKKITHYLLNHSELPKGNPVQTYLQNVGASTSPQRDLAAFERDFSARIERAHSIDQLIAVWQWAKNLEPLPVAPLLELAERLSSSQEWRVAADVLKAALRLQPEDFEIHRQLGWYLQQLGPQYDSESLASFERALELNPRDPETLGMIGGRFKRLKQFPEAAKYYTEAAKVSPNSLYVLVNQAAVKILADLSDTSEGVTLYSELVAKILAGPIDQADIWAELVLAEAFFAIGNDADSHTHYRQAVNLATSPKSLHSAARQLEIFAEAGFRTRSARKLAKLLRSGKRTASHADQASEGERLSTRVAVEKSSYELPLIIHLSDLHFGKHVKDGVTREMHRFHDGLNSQALSKHVIEEFKAKSSRYSSDISRIHLVVSGDLTYLGTESEFDLARFSVEEICDGLNIPKERVHFVPGNHDVNWGLSKADPRKRLDNYIAFLVRFYGEKLFPARYPKIKWPLTYLASPPPPSDIISFDSDEKAGIVIAGLNSCVYENEQHHYGFIGDNQLRSLKSMLTDLNPPREWIRIAVIHHHLHPFPEFLDTRGDAPVWLDVSTLRDAGHVERYLERLGFDIVLHGHKHKPLMRETRVRDLQPLESEPLPLIVCGAGSVSCVELEHNVANHYQIIDVTRIPRQPGAEFLRVDWRTMPLDAGAEWFSSKIWEILG